MDEAPEIRPLPGAVQRLAPGLRVVLAPNPSPMTFHGTNSYILGEGEVAVIDPGPAEPRHLRALRDALAPGERISHIFVTHSHLDHSPLARPLAAATGAPVLAFGHAMAGRSAAMERLAASGTIAGGEGVDTGFTPDETLADGTEIAGKGWMLRALHTPGHMGNHLSFLWDDAVFAGDQVMGWSTSIVSPPDGDMGAYMASLDRLAARRPRRLYAGHGDPVGDPVGRIADLVAHRRAREAAILAALTDGPADAMSLARAIYQDTPAPLLPAAARNVLAHLIDLMNRNRAFCEGIPAAGSRFRRL
ncbi:MAG: MBL fold metallo-hydrolase [Rhodobacteraceae bacterium]|jgi:hydroxyacylglutathione hydrolase|uniref:MBL fold metallo-hydrolase n=1 Tax=Albidovulum sp. TaxID=1872424 RepID=UPI00265B1338|nr:MBL fold metallo-hydrolase [uncultured Defluviimonas sp.]MCC0068394.1 MBL fold metallo-hydrolase [Paracoccaceae bacterium]